MSLPFHIRFEGFNFRSGVEGIFTFGVLDPPRHLEQEGNNRILREV